MKALLPLFIAVFAYSADVSTLIAKAYQNNPTLKKLELQVQSSEYDIKNSDIYKNPVLTFGLNDININEPSKRDLEAMQATYVTIAQEFTDGDKLEQKSKIAYINKQIFQIALKEKKDQIAKEIYTLAYSIKELEEKIKLNNKKLLNLEDIKNYHNNNIQNAKAFQQTLKSDLMIDSLNLQIQVDTEQIEQNYAKLSELVNEEVKTIDDISSVYYGDKIESHKLLQIEDLNIKKAMAQKQLARENESSDYTLSAGYFHREDKFDDYINVAIKFPLNIYSKEKNELAKAFKQSDIAKQNYDEVKNKLNKKYKIELSKYRLSLSSIKYLEQILSHIKKERELSINQNNRDSVISTLDLENKIIENKIKMLGFKKQYQISRVELAYLTSTLNN